MNALGRTPLQTSMPPPISAPAPPNTWNASTIVPAPASTFTDAQTHYAALSPVQAVEKYMELKPKARGRDDAPVLADGANPKKRKRSEEHTSELQSLMRISYAVFCLKKKKKQTNTHKITTNKTSMT